MADCWAHDNQVDVAGRNGGLLRFHVCLLCATPVPEGYRRRHEQWHEGLDRLNNPLQQITEPHETTGEAAEASPAPAPENAHYEVINGWLCEVTGQGEPEPLAQIQDMIEIYSQFSMQWSEKNCGWGSITNNPCLIPRWVRHTHGDEHVEVFAGRYQQKADGVITLSTESPEMSKDVRQYLRAHVSEVMARDLLVRYGSVEDAVMAKAMGQTIGWGGGRTLEQAKADNKEALALYQHLIEVHRIPTEVRVQYVSRDKSLTELRRLHHRFVVSDGYKCGWTHGSDVVNEPLVPAEQAEADANNRVIKAIIDVLSGGMELTTSQIGARLSREGVFISSTELDPFLYRLTIQGKIVRNPGGYIKAPYRPKLPGRD